MSFNGPSTIHKNGIAVFEAVLRQAMQDEKTGWTFRCKFTEGRIRNAWLDLQPPPAFSVADGIHFARPMDVHADSP